MRVTCADSFECGLVCKCGHACGSAWKTGRVRSVTADGNCLFRCISVALHNTEKYHRLVRQELVRYVIENWSELFEVLTGFPNGESYGQYMLRDRRYGTIAELRAFGEKYKRSVAVVQGGVLRARSVHPGDVRPVVLRLKGSGERAHYDLFVKLPSGLDMNDEGAEQRNDAESVRRCDGRGQRHSGLKLVKYAVSRFVNRLVESS